VSLEVAYTSIMHHAASLKLFESFKCSMVFIRPLQKNKFHCDWGNVFTCWADVDYVPDAAVKELSLVCLPGDFFSRLDGF